VKRLFVILALVLSGCTTQRMGISQMCLAVHSFDKAKAITYKEEKIGDYWQTPNETIQYKTGDCEDKTIYLQRLLTDRGIKSRIVFGKGKPTDAQFHAWNEVEINGEIYILDATDGVFSKYEYLKEERPQFYTQPRLSIFEIYAFNLNKKFFKTRLKEWKEDRDLLKNFDVKYDGE